MKDAGFASHKDACSQLRLAITQQVKLRERAETLNLVVSN